MPSRNRALAGITGIVGVILAAVLFTASPAVAHDELVDSVPTASEDLSTPPEVITLTYSADILEMGAEVIVVDAEGTNWVEGEPIVDATVVTATLAADMPPAGYEARWRVVSSDGHPISGVVPFTVGGTEPLAPSDTTSGDSEAEEADASADIDTTQAENEAALRTLLIALTGAIVAIGAFIVIALLVKRRRARSSGTDAR